MSFRDNKMSEISPGDEFAFSNMRDIETKVSRVASRSILRVLEK